MSETQMLCSIIGCDRPHRIYGWCNTHYFRWYRTGDPGPAEIKARRTGCQVKDCDQPHHSRGYCHAHYRRFLKHGDPLHLTGPATGERNGTWTGDDATYPGVHRRLKRTLGSASQHQCRACTQPAKEWAYDHSDPDGKQDDRGRRYSTDLTRYIPLCISCHRRLDAAARHERSSA